MAEKIQLTDEEKAAKAKYEAEKQKKNAEMSAEDKVAKRQAVMASIKKLREQE